MKKTKIIFLFAVALLFLVCLPVSALEIKKYPSIPGLPSVSDNSNLGVFVAYFFGLGTYLAGFLAVISIAIGSVQIIASASNPEATSQGKDRIKGSLLGLLLIVSAFIILQTINPKLVTPSLGTLKPGAGIFYAKGMDLRSAPMSESNLSETVVVKQGYGDLYYKCSETGPGTGPNVIVWKFTKPGLENGNNLATEVTVQIIGCNERATLTGSGSFKIMFETPGVYFYLGENCAGYSSYANVLPDDKITDVFAGKIKSVRIVNGKDDSYGVIFHNKIDASSGSDCTWPIKITAAGQTCLNVSAFSNPFTVGAVLPLPTYSAEIFNQNIVGSSGDGVIFYGNVNGWDAGNKSAFKKLNEAEIRGAPQVTAETIKFNYVGIQSDFTEKCTDPLKKPCRDLEKTVPPDPKFIARDCCLCDSPKDWNLANVNCGGSIRLTGKYLVTLYTRYAVAENYSMVQKIYCQSFTEDAPNLSTASFLPQGNTRLEFVNIIPIK